MARRGGRDRQARDPAYPAAQLRHPPARGRHGPAHDPAAARPPQPVDHRALPARRHQHGVRRRQSAGPAWTCPGRRPEPQAWPAPSWRWRTSSATMAPPTGRATPSTLEPRAAARSARHRALPHRRPGRPRRAVRCRAAIPRISYNSCRNRHCPKCQALARAAVARGAQGRAAAGRVFPRRLHPPASRSPPSPCRTSAWSTTSCSGPPPRRCSTIAADPRHLGAEIGFIAVLHTWGQNLQHHPHLHCVVPGGGLSPDGERWIACRPGFFLPVRVLSRLFRRQFLEALDAAFRAGELSFHASLAELAEPAPVRPAPRRRPWRRVGGLRQAAVRRSGAGAGVPRPLHPPGGDHQPPAGQDRGRQVAFRWKDYRHHDAPEGDDA